MPKAKAAKAKPPLPRAKAKAAAGKATPNKSATRKPIAKARGGVGAVPKVASARAGKWVYAFGDGRAEGRASMRDTLGGKGANLAEMASLGLPVPPGFTITADVCNYYYAKAKTYPTDLAAQVDAA